MSMSDASIPVFEIGLNALAALLDKAEAYAEAKRIDPAALLNARLFPDMFAFTRQVQSACDQAKNAAARLAGVDPPGFEDNEKTFAELKARIAKTSAFLKTLDARRVDASADREITFPLGPRKGHMRGADYLNHFACQRGFDSHHPLHPASHVIARSCDTLTDSTHGIHQFLQVMIAEIRSHRQ
ncbi:MAG: DUF1993 domain-containing protein [Gammaproteobacteria bacterium]|nr:MAG: DUF1993 domain-containing protein [Gammaproteobacteria bacterium]